MRTSLTFTLAVVFVVIMVLTSDVAEAYRHQVARRRNSVNKRYILMHKIRGILRRNRRDDEEEDSKLQAIYDKFDHDWEKCTNICHSDDQECWDKKDECYLKA